MNMTPFDFKGRQVRVIVDEHGEPWFVGKDICDLLGYADQTNAIKQHCKGVVKRHPLSTPGGIQEMRILSEPDMLRLIVNSQLPAALSFEQWVFEDVLPQIRKTGGYQRPMTQTELIAASANQMVFLERQQAAQQVEIERVQGSLADHARLIEDLSHSRVWDHCPQNCLSLTGVKAEMSKRYGLSGPVVDFVLKNWMHQPNPAGMVRNGHEDAKGSQYQIWPKTNVTMAFKRFVDGYQMVTATQATHPDIEGRFQLRLKGSV